MTKRTRYFLAGSAAIIVAGLCTGLVAYYGGGFPSLSASRSGPAELSYVPADASIVAFANVGEVMASQMRQRLKERMPNEQGQQEFQRATGIDIEQLLEVRELVHRFLPNVVQHGAIAKAGLRFEVPRAVVPGARLPNRARSTWRSR